MAMLNNQKVNGGMPGPEHMGSQVVFLVTPAFFLSQYPPLDTDLHQLTTYFSLDAPGHA